MNKYDEIKKGAINSPNKYNIFAKNVGDIGLSILPDVINQCLKRDIDPKPNKNYYVDDGEFSIKISTGEDPDELAFTYYIKHNVEEEIKPIEKKDDYKNFLSSTTMYMVSVIIVVIMLVIFSMPILKGLFG